MKKQLVPMTLAGTVALAISLSAQTGAPPSTTQSQPSASRAGAVTVEGCLMREDDVPGRKANVAERAGLGEDFILTSTKMVEGAAPSAPSATPGAVGTSGTTSGAMYDINGIDDETLRKHINRRVQVEGSFENLDARGDALIEIRATAVRPASGECPRQ